MDFVSIEEGHKIVSVSKDGSAKIWDCSSSKCLSTLKVEEEAFLNSCLVGPQSSAGWLGLFLRSEPIIIYLQND